MIISDGVCLAKELRDRSNLKKISNARPGYYKWWATAEAVFCIAEKIGISNGITDCMENKEIFGEVRYCIYIGIAVGESVRSRLDWHINQINDEKNVKNGRLSTLRQTISSIFGRNMLDNGATNEFIDRLAVEYFLSDNARQSDAAKIELHEIERSFLKNKLYILNIQENKHPLAPTAQLRALRSKARNI